VGVVSPEGAMVFIVVFQWGIRRRYVGVYVGVYVGIFWISAEAAKVVLGLGNR
jgi:hypothetical protein